MSRARSVQAIKDEAPDLEARIITAIGKAGPRNVAQISRMTGAHQETIRYKIKKRFGRLGFRFHAEVDYAKLGLHLHWASLSFSKTYNSMAPQILRALNQVGYLVYYGKVVPQGDYATLFALPNDTTDQYTGFLSGLCDKGVLSNFTLDELLVRRHKTMDPTFFNFRSGRWEIEWPKVAATKPASLALSKTPSAVDFDYYDLLVIKELQKDALQHLTGIARKLKIHQKTLEYHYRTHVQKLKLVPWYRTRWTQDITKRQIHSTATIRTTFRNLTKSEFTDVQGAVSKIPFLWSEDLLRDGTYIAMMYVPLTEMISMANYINAAAPSLASRVEVGFINVSDASSFTIPYNLYQNGTWRFDARRLETTLRKESVVPLQK